MGKIDLRVETLFSQAKPLGPSTAPGEHVRRGNDDSVRKRGTSDLRHHQGTPVKGQCNRVPIRGELWCTRGAPAAPPKRAEAGVSLTKLGDATLKSVNILAFTGVFFPAFTLQYFSGAPKLSRRSTSALTQTYCLNPLNKMFGETRRNILIHAQWRR